MNCAKQQFCIRIQSVKETLSIIPAANPSATDSMRSLRPFVKQITAAPSNVDNPAAEDKSKARTAGCVNIVISFYQQGQSAEVVFFTGAGLAVAFFAGAAFFTAVFLTAGFVAGAHGVHGTLKHF